MWLILWESLASLLCRLMERIKRRVLVYSTKMCYLVDWLQRDTNSFSCFSPPSERGHLFSLYLNVDWPFLVFWSVDMRPVWEPSTYLLIILEPSAMVQEANMFVGIVRVEEWLVDATILNLLVSVQLLVVFNVTISSHPIEQKDHLTEPCQIMEWWKC